MVIVHVNLTGKLGARLQVSRTSSSNDNTEVLTKLCVDVHHLCAGVILRVRVPVVRISVVRRHTPRVGFVLMVLVTIAIARDTPLSTSKACPT
jgi:hypothetical protein